MPTPTVIKQWQYSDSINRRVWDQNYLFDNFQIKPMSSSAAGGATSGVAGANNVLWTGNGLYEWNVIGTQTILQPQLDSFGLNLVQDAVSGDGIELCVGQTAQSYLAFQPGTSRAFFMTAEFRVEDASGCNPLIIGFRQIGAFNATLSNYANLASIGIVGTANPNTLQIQTQLSSGGIVATNTTQTVADATVFRVSVYVSSTGAVTYLVNSAAPTVTAAYTFPAGITVVPFIRFTQAVDVTTQASCDFLEIGYQS